MKWMWCTECLTKHSVIPSYPQIIFLHKNRDLEGPELWLILMGLNKLKKKIKMTVLIDSFLVKNINKKIQVTLILPTNCLKSSRRNDNNLPERRLSKMMMTSLLFPNLTYRRKIQLYLMKTPLITLIYSIWAKNK